MIEEELYKKNLNKIEAYIKENKERALAMINDEEAAALSLIELSGKEDFIDSAMLTSYIRRGLIEKKDCLCSLTHLGLKIASYYPLLGNMRDKRRIYDSAFFAFLLSFTKNKRLSSKRSSWMRYLQSDDITKLFPRRDKERVKKAIIKSFESFIRLKIVKDGDGFLSLDIDRAKAFMALGDVSKLSYIYSDENLKEGAFAISLALMIEGIKERELDRYIDLIEKITGIKLDREFLFDFEVLKLDNGYVSGALIDKSTTEDAIISSDFTLSYSGSLDCPLYLFLEAEKDDVVSQWRVTKDSIKAAFDYGYNLETLKETMKSICKAKLPDMLFRRLEGWWDNYSKIKLKYALLLETDIKNARLIDRLDAMKEYIISRPSDTLFIMDLDREDEWREILLSSGFDMLSMTKGEKTLKESSSAPSFYDFTDFVSLNDEREIKYSESFMKDVFDSSDNLIEKLLTQNGIRFAKDQHYTPALVSGFCYTEKLSLIADAVKNKMNIYASLPDGREFTFSPVDIKKGEEDAIAFTEKGSEIPISIIYKAASVDKTVKATI